MTHPLAHAGLNYLETTLDTYRDGWPEGAGMVEANGMGAKKLDVAVYTIRALNDLAEMATSKGDAATAKWASGLAGKLAKDFDSDWWITNLGLYADSLALNHQVPTDPGATLGTAPITQLEQYYWTNATPMETAFAPTAHAGISFPQLENTQLPGPVFTGANGFYQHGRMDESLKYLEFVASENWL